MARVTSEKTRQFRFVVDEAMEDGIPIDNIALFLPDGTPINLTADPSKMRWLGDWDVATTYVLNDVVMDDGNLYIVELAEIAAGGAAPSAPNVDWVRLTTEPDMPGFKGDWDSAVTYIPGDTVLRNGELYGTVVENTNQDPAIVPGNVDVPALGVQATTADKLDNGVEVVRTFDATSQIKTDDGARAVIFAVDFPVPLPGGSYNLNIHVENDTQDTITLRHFAQGEANTASSLTGFTGAAAVPTGTSIDTIIRFTSFYGTGAGQRLILFGDADTAGEVRVTLGLVAGPDLIGPPTFPWEILSEVTRAGTRAVRLTTFPHFGRLWRETDTGVIYRGTGATWEIFNPVGQLRKTSDFTLPQSDVALSSTDNDVPQLSWPVGANEVWIVESLLRLQGVSNAADIKFDFSLPAGATFAIMRDAIEVGQPAGTDPAVVSAVSIDFGLVNGVVFARLVAYIVIGATAGTAKLRAAQNTSTAENVKVLTNSLLFPRRIA